MTPTPEQLSEFQVAEMFPLILRLRSYLMERQAYTATSKVPVGPETLARKFGFTTHKKNNPEVILAGNVAVELGHPSTASRAIVLITYKSHCLVNGQISIVGPDLHEMDRHVKYPYAQVVMLGVKNHNTPNPFYLENTQYLLNRLPGYMVRSVPGKLWARISKTGLKKGLRLQVVGAALMAAYATEFEAIENTEIVFVTQSREDVESLNQIASEANILSGRHKKLILGADGNIECSELNCETCDEKPVCDNLRDIIIKGREQRK